MCRYECCALELLRDREHDNILVFFFHHPQIHPDPDPADWTVAQALDVETVMTLQAATIERCDLEIHSSSNDMQSSTYDDTSFVLKNKKDVPVTAIFIDVTDAVVRDSGMRLSTQCSLFPCPSVHA